jgi:hippurate hydrolase
VKLQLTVRSYKPEIRQHLLDGIARIAKGEAIAAGMPEDRMPQVSLRDDYTPATFNTDPLTSQIVEQFTKRFGPERISKVPPTMGGEDFSQYYLADKKVQSLIFWVGGVPQDRFAAAKGDLTKLPPLHSAQWAPDAAAVIDTGSQAMVTAALTVLGKR